MLLSQLSSATAFKVWSAVVIWMLGVAGGWLPLLVQDVSPRIRSVLTMFAGGIFFAGAILHLLPDAVDNEALAHLGAPSTSDHDDVESSAGSSSLWAFFFFATGFLIILFMEAFALQVQRCILQKGSTTSCRTDSSPSSAHTTADEDYFIMEEDPTPPIVVAASSAHDDHDTTLGMANLHNLPPIVSMIVFLALSFHSVMEGVAIGANPDSAWDIFIAISVHKAFAAFALGLELLSNSVSTKRLIWSMLLFSVMTPLGIALGWWITNVITSEAAPNDDESSDETVASGICTALSAGTFLYVAVMEIIPQELQNPQDQGFKCLALLVGFASFGTLAIWI